MSEELTTEALYFRAYHSFLLQRPEFKSDYEMLKEQAQLYPASFKALSHSDRKRIRCMQESYKTGRFTLFEGGSIDNSGTALPYIEKGQKNHKELCEEIYRNSEKTLVPFTGGPFDFASFEFPVLFGDIDLLVEHNRISYIIEVKTDTIDCDIIGQVMKYFVGLSLKLCLKLFDDIKIITICPSYEPAAYNGLRQISALPLFINLKTFEVSERP